MTALLLAVALMLLAAGILAYFSDRADRTEGESWDFSDEAEPTPIYDAAHRAVYGEAS